MALLLINRWGVTAAVLPLRFERPDGDDEGRNEDRDDTPDTPLDEPAPVPVRDPPPQPDDQGPFVVAEW